MRTVLGIAMMILASALTAQAQYVSTHDLGGFSFGGPKTNVTVINNTDDNSSLVADINGKRTILRHHGDTARVSMGWFTPSIGQFPIFIWGCGPNSMNGFRYNAPPDWATDQGNFPGVALDREFLTSHPTKKQIGHRVDAIKHMLDGYPGDKAKKHELDDWRKGIEKAGVSQEMFECEHSQPIPLIGNNWASQSGYNQEIVITVVGGDGRYSYINPARGAY